VSDRITRWTQVSREYRAGWRAFVRSLPILWKASPVYTAVILGGVLLQGILPPVSVLISKDLVNTAIAAAPGHSAQPVLELLILWLGVVLLSTVALPVTTAVQGLLTEKLTALVNVMLMEKSRDLPGISYFEDPRFHDDIELVQSEAAWRPVNFLVFSASIIRNVLAVLSLLVILAGFHPMIPVLVVLTLFPQAYVQFQLQRSAFETMVWMSPEARKMKYYSTTMLSDHSAKEIRLHNAGDLFIGLYKRAFTQVHQLVRRIRFRQATWSTAWVMLSVLGSGAAFWWIVLRTLNGQFTAGDILLFTQALLMSRQHIAAVVEESGLLYETLLYMQKFFAYLDLPPNLPLAPAGKSAGIRQSIVSIEFSNVSFQYKDDGPNVLQGVSFVIRPGETVALVGENGAGKTTIVKLLARLYDPTRGQIRINGEDLRDINLQEWRRNLAVVFQDFVHFQLTVRENVALGALDHLDDLDRIREACIRSGASSVVEELPQGYDTVLGRQFEGGVELSGGEWQKIALARAFIKDAPVVILDEPTAALDPRSEFELYRRFAELMRGKTVLLISHRLSAARMADRILVLEHGRIVEEGTHESLMTRGGRYAELYRMQASHYEA
jgi:ATP-binding cassette subfamily B protein